VAVLTHENARAARGLQVVHWLEGRGLVLSGLPDIHRKRVERWRRGGQARYEAVADLLDWFGLQSWELPVTVWCHYDNGRRGCSKRTARAVSWPRR
jgi:hypothetical protein